MSHLNVYLNCLFEKVHLKLLFGQKFLNKEERTKAPVSTEDVEKDG